MERYRWYIIVVYRFGHGLKADIWGANTWTFDHAVTLQNQASPAEEKFYYELHEENLSCTSCTKSFAKFRRKHPYFIESKKQGRQLSSLLNQAHNKVNQKN